MARNMRITNVSYRNFSRKERKKERKEEKKKVEQTGNENDKARVACCIKYVCKIDIGDYYYKLYRLIITAI